MATTDPPDSASYSLRAADRVCDILDILADTTEGVTLSQVAASASLPKSSAFRYLAALEARRYAERDATTGTYRLGIAFRPQDAHALAHLDQVAEPIVNDIRDRLAETVNLGLLDGSMVVHRLVAESPHMMRLAARPGERGHVHCTALGKAICATLPVRRVRSILAASGMPKFTDATLTDPEAFLAELEDVKVVGYGVDDAENQPAGRCVAVIIPGLDIPAGLSLSAPADRLPRELVPQVAAELTKAAKSISRELSR